ncbi:MAG: hypothetical protein JWN14_4484 [Chthonomonadales bacterium]|nr:hypothetical protein [Chthonomonadales bacterium]
MTMIQYTAEVKAGLLLALPTDAEELHLKPGDKVHIQLARDTEDTPQARSNEGMLVALRTIAERQKGQRYTDASDTDRRLREGRAGAMWRQVSEE